MNQNSYSTDIFATIVVWRIHARDPSFDGGESEHHCHRGTSEEIQDISTNRSRYHVYYVLRRNASGRGRSRDNV